MEDLRQQQKALYEEYMKQSKTLGPEDIIKSTKLFKEYLIKSRMLNPKFKEQNKDLEAKSIHEVGEATTKPYDWELLSTIRGDYTYGFTTDSGIEYRVFIESLDFDDEKTGELVKGIEIGFIAGEAGKEKSDKTVINRGEVFRVMATVANIIQTSIKLTPEFKQTQAIVYNPASKEGEGVTGNQRDKLYQAFIKKAFPRASFERNGTAIVSKLDPPKEKP